MTKTQKKILELADKPVTALFLAKSLKSYPGPMGRCLTSLVKAGWVKSRLRPTGVEEFIRTAAGKKVLG